MSILTIARWSGSSPPAGAILLGSDADPSTYAAGSSQAIAYLGLTNVVTVPSVFSNVTGPQAQALTLTCQFVPVGGPASPVMNFLVYVWDPAVKIWTLIPGAPAVTCGGTTVDVIVPILWGQLPAPAANSGVIFALVPQVTGAPNGNFLTNISVEYATPLADPTLPAGAATAANQALEIAQLVAIDAATSSTAGPWTCKSTTALVTNIALKIGAGILRGFSGQIDATAPSGTYYLQAFDSGVLPTTATQATMPAPLQCVTTTGTPFPFSFDGPESGQLFAAGCWIVISTTQFTVTLAGAYLSLTGFTK